MRNTVGPEEYRGITWKSVGCPEKYHGFTGDSQKAEGTDFNNLQIFSKEDLYQKNTVDRIILHNRALLSTGV